MDDRIPGGTLSIPAIVVGVEHHALGACGGHDLPDGRFEPSPPGPVGYDTIERRATERRRQRDRGEHCQLPPHDVGLALADRHVQSRVVQLAP